MKSKLNWKKVVAPEPHLFVVASAEIMCRSVLQGKIIPLVILDTTKHHEIDRIIDLHNYIQSGNVLTTWGKSKDEAYLTLSVKFLDPSPMVFTVVFPSHPYALTVDFVISSQMLYIQGGKPGDKLKHDIERPKILMEVPSEEFACDWKELYLKLLAKRFKILRCNKQTANKLALDFYNELNAFRDMRMKR